MKRSDADVVARTQPWDTKLDKAYFRCVLCCAAVLMSPQAGALHARRNRTRWQLGMMCRVPRRCCTYPCRGAPSCGEMPHGPVCARSWVARLAQANHSRDLDAGACVRCVMLCRGRCGVDAHSLLQLQA
jgi:hypothetical protein